MTTYYNFEKHLFKIEERVIALKTDKHRLLDDVNSKMDSLLQKMDAIMAQSSSQLPANAYTINASVCLPICLCTSVYAYGFLCLLMFAYVCRLLMHICLCLWFLMFAYVCLCMLSVCKTPHSNGDPPPLRLQQPAPKPSIFPSDSDSQHSFTYLCEFSESSTLISLIFIAKSEFSRVLAHPTTRNATKTSPTLRPTTQTTWERVPSPCGPS
jgi:hypothetical protein